MRSPLNLVWLLSLWALPGCMSLFLTGEPQDRNPTDDHPLPVLANAGADREILRGFTAVLSGAGSHSPAGLPFSVRWEQLEGGPRVLLSNSRALSPTFLAPLEETTLTFRLIADDGTWTTSDDVTLHVKHDPTRLAPPSTAASDRVVSDPELLPQHDDILTAVTDEMTSSWVRLEPQSSSKATSPSAEPPPAAIYRLEVTRDGLAGAPDYLILLADEYEQGNQAPVATLQGPSFVAPGEAFTLNARGSTDVNGDSLRFRWEQVQGTPLLPAPLTSASVDLVAPAQVQELRFRVFVSDGVLESAPGTLSVLVTPPGGAAPTVAPQGDLRVHPGNQVLLNADHRAAPEPGVTFFWMQTYGSPLPLDLEDDGRLARFVAPPQPAELAFVVHASAPGTPIAVESAPAVARVTVVEESDNTPPTITLCSKIRTTPQGVLVVVSAQIKDPEYDEVDVPSWDISATPIHPLNWEARLPDEIVLDDLCLNDTAYDTSPHGIESHQVAITVPTGVEEINANFEICDTLSACAESSTTVYIE